MNWKEEYNALKNYIDDNAEMVINATEISIPQNVRDEFYRRFDNLRQAVVEENCPALTVDFDTLSENFLKVEKEILELMKLDAIGMPVDLSSFLRNPKDGLMRILYNRTFDLLQGKISLEFYEQQARDDLRSVSRELFRLGYEHWAALVFMKLLEPDEAYLVDLDDDYKPFLRELKDISFGRQAHHPTMRIPEFVLHSSKLNRYVAVKMALEREIETYVVPFKPPVRPRKKTGDTSSALDSRAMLLSFMSSRDTIPVIADIYDRKLNSPDWMMEFILEEDLRDSDALGQVKRDLQSLNPRLGVCLVLIKGSEEANLDDVPDNIYPVSVGFDQSKLKEVVEKIMQEA